MSGESKAVFLSYASEDAEAAARIADELKAAGIKVWFDRNALRGGDEWDQRIRREIRECTLFIPLVSANSEARHEGYFRLEWDLADQRSHMIVRGRAFILPVALDDTRESGAGVPDSFQRAQWTRLPGGETPPTFVERIQRLLGPEVTVMQLPAAPAAKSMPGTATAPTRTSRRARVGWTVGLLVTAGVMGLFAVERFRILRPAPIGSTAPAPAMAAVSAEKSIAVLPFVSLSSDKEQEFFADGLAEELLDLLAKTPGLHVVARTSSFSFKGKSDDIPTIAAKLRVANILEGSVRKSANRLRVTTQLVRAADGEQLWSETYDRELKDIFKVQDEIAAAVTGALKLKLAPGQESLPSRSTNTDAYLQYLLGQQYFSRDSDDDYRRAVAAYKQAIALDPNYAAAYAGLSMAESYLAADTGDNAGINRAREAAERAIALAPDQPMGYASRGDLRSTFLWDWTGAQADFTKALELGPNDPFVLRRYSILLGALGQLSEAIVAAQESVDLDPYSVHAWNNLGAALAGKGELAAARRAIRRGLTINSADRLALSALGTIELLDRHPQDALAVFGRIDASDEGGVGFRLTGIAMAEHDLGHAPESKQALDEVITKRAGTFAYQIAQAYAWTGQKEQAFAWLERAYRQRDGGLAQGVKTDPVLASIKGDPRYAAMLKKLHLE